MMKHTDIKSRFSKQSAAYEIRNQKLYMHLFESFIWHLTWHSHKTNNLK